MKIIFFPLFITTILLVISVTEASSIFLENSQPPPSTQKRLELKKGYTTSSVTKNHMPQLICTNLDEVNPSQLPDVVYCTNHNIDKRAVPKWKCQANLPKELDFGVTKVTCEAYQDETDNSFNVLYTTCYLEYTLIMKRITRVFTLTRDQELGHICYHGIMETPKLHHECNEYYKRMNSSE